jgi:hypothetical protein
VGLAKNDPRALCTNVRTVSEHLKNIFTDNELEQTAVIQNFRITDVLGVDGSKETVVLLTIRHHRQLSFDFARLWLGCS